MAALATVVVFSVVFLLGVRLAPPHHWSALSVAVLCALFVAFLLASTEAGRWLSAPVWVVGSFLAVTISLFSVCNESRGQRHESCRSDEA